MIPTFNREELLNQNLRLLGENLRYAGSVRILVSDDSDNDDLAFYPEDRTVESTFPIEYWRNSSRLGLGGNLNKLIEAAGAETQLAISMDDDHRLVKPLDITPHVRKLMSDPTAGWIRLMGTAGHRLTATLETDYWRVSWWSAELYITSFRAHLFKLQEWVETYGPFPVTKRIGECEERYNHLCKDIARERIGRKVPTLDVLVPLVAPEDCWSESGQSHQLAGY